MGVYLGFCLRLDFLCMNVLMSACLFFLLRFMDFSEA